MSSLCTSTISDNNLSTPTIQQNPNLKALEMANNNGTLPTPKTAKPKKQLKKLKDPEAPMRPLSPYMLFVKGERTKIVADMGTTVAMGELGKEIGRGLDGPAGEEVRGHLQEG